MRASHSFDGFTRLRCSHGPLSFAEELDPFRHGLRTGGGARAQCRPAGSAGRATHRYPHHDPFLPAAQGGAKLRRIVDLSDGRIARRRAPTSRGLPSTGCSPPSRSLASAVARTGPSPSDKTGSRSPGNSPMDCFPVLLTAEHRRSTIATGLGRTASLQRLIVTLPVPRAVAGRGRSRHLRSLNQWFPM